MNDVELRKAIDEVEEIGPKPENWALYISRKKAILDEVSREASYRERLEEVQKQGLEQGKKDIERKLLKLGDSMEKYRK